MGEALKQPEAEEIKQISNEELNDALQQTAKKQEIEDSVGVSENKVAPEPQKFVLPDGRVIFGDSDDYKQALINMREAQ